MMIIKNFNKKIIFTLMFVFAFTFGFGNANFLFENNASAEENLTEYEEQVNTLAENVAFSTDVKNFYEQATPTTVYNFVVVARFLGETDVLTNLVSGQTYTYIEALEEMYNSDTNYSVKKYYQAVSNGLLTMQTVFVTTSSSLEISKARSVYGEESINGGVGYDESNMIMGVLPEQYALEYELIGEIFDHAITTTIEPSYPQAADSNGDGKIDSLSIVYLPDPNAGTASEVNIGWSDLLWPHQGQTQIDLIASYAPLAPMLGYDIAVEYYEYTYLGTTYTAFNYNMTHFESDDIDSRTGLPDNNTTIHELGHTLGWPDYYVYGDASFPGSEEESDKYSVNNWDIMAYSHMQTPQYPTTYSRSIQNWVSDGYGIEEISANGNYTLKSVNYEEITGTPFAGRTVAYKITNPDNEYQSIWFEYRKGATNTFEDNTTINDGLIVYRVDEGFDTAELMSGGMKNAGNFAAAPYNMFVFRNDISGYTTLSEVQRAALNMDNQSMGDDATYSIGGRTYTAADITWQNYVGDVNTYQDAIDSADVSYVDSGIEVSIVNVNDAANEITFNINWATFPSTNGALVERSSFGDNNLYNQLLSLAGKLVTDDLYENDLQDITSLDFNGLGITSMQGLELLNFNSLQKVNFNFNSLSSRTHLQAVMAANPSAVISLIGNSFNLDDMSTTNLSLLQNTNLIWGMQNNLYPQTKYLINNLNLQREYYYQSSYDLYFDFTLNGVELTPSSSLQWHTFNQYGKFEFDFVATQAGGFTQRSSEGIITVHIVGAILPSTQIERNDEFPELTILGIDESELNIVRNPVGTIDTSYLQADIYVSWNVSIAAEPAVSQMIYDYYDVMDTQGPEVTLTESTTIEMAPTDLLADYLPATEITITDNGEAVSYAFIADPELTDVSYWTKNYYYINGQTQTAIGQIDGQGYGEYRISYMAVDAEGNDSLNVIRTVLIVAPEVEVGDFADEKLYDAILELTPGFTKVYENSLEGISYINLSNKGITSLEGLQNLNYSASTVIDLSQNNISDISVINDLILDENISKINLMLNNFNPYVTPVTTNSKYILGIQGMTQDIYLNGMIDPVFGEVYALYFHNYNDYAADFTIDISPSVSITAGDNFVFAYGEYEFAINSLGGFASETRNVKYGDVTISATNIEVEVFESFSLLDEITYNVLTSDDVQMEYILGTNNVIDPETYEFSSTVGTSVLTINYYINSLIVRSVVSTISILDLIAPTISLNGEEMLYLMVGDEYSEAGYIADDNYQIETVNQTGQVDTEVSGIYEIKYQAVDTSQNSSQELTRTVYVGNITAKEDFVVDVKERVEEVEMFTFEAYSPEDFDIVIEQSYNQNIVGEYNVEINLTHKQEATFTVNLINTINVLDRIKPTITLNGDLAVYMYVGDSYIESGALVTDNYDEPKSIGSSSNSLDVGNIGTYELLYTARDSQNNEALSVLRTVYVMARPFDNLDVKLETNQDSLTLGNVIIFSVDTSGFNLNYYNFDSTFVWYVDGEEVQRDENIYLRTTFNKVGTHQVEVKALNTLINPITNAIYQELSAPGEVLSISIEEGNFIDTYGPAMIGGVSISIVVSVFYSFIARRRRKFYF